MIFDPPLVPVRLAQRYKRFLADVTCPDGTGLTVHCPNPGAMTGLAEPGARIWIRDSRNPKRKLRWSWVLTELSDANFVCIDTSLANPIVANALAENRIDAFAGASAIKPEIRRPDGSRLDFRLSDTQGRHTFVEVKSVTLCRDKGLAEFPDTRTARGSRHLSSLVEAIGEGHRAAMLYVVQRNDCDRFRVAADIDPSYAKAMEVARDAGVSFHAYSTAPGMDGISLSSVVKMHQT